MDGNKPYANCTSIFHQTLSSLGLNQTSSDTSLYTMNHPMHGICIVLVYVDDSLIILDSLKWIESAKPGMGD
jgi:hypothetical protein